MREPAFWSGSDTLLSTVLTPAAALYGAIAGRRMARPGRSAGLPVICIGNLTLGGAGKTPTALAVGRILADAGHRPGFLSRGYGGRLAGPVAVDPRTHTAADVGDEPLLLARAASTVVARDRVAGARAARDTGADVIVMDDGFQNPSLEKNLSVIVVDGARGIGNGRVFPAGPLRASLAAQLERAQAVLLIGEDRHGMAARVAAVPGLRLFRGALAPDAAALAGLAGKPVLAYAGIGDPSKFFDTLRAAGIAVADTAAFPDHHRFTAAEMADLLARAQRAGLALVSTEKDLARLAGDPAAAPLMARTAALPVRLEVEAQDAFAAFLRQRLAAACAARGLSP